MAVLGDPHIAGSNTRDRAVRIVEHFGSGEARIDFDAAALRLRGEPAVDIFGGELDELARA